MDNPGEAKASPQQTMDNEEEAPFFTMYAHVVPTARSLDPESEEDELSLSSEVVDKKFDKMEFLNKLQTAISQLISTLLEEPTKTYERKKQCRKNLCDREEKHLTNDTGMGSIIMQSKAASQCSGNMENVIHHLVRSDSEVSEQVQRKIRTKAEHWAAVEKDAAQQKRRAIQIDQEVAEAELQEAYLQKKQPDNIQLKRIR